MSDTDEAGLPRSATLSEDSISDIYRREAPRLANFFRRHVLLRDDVPDLVQESFARLVGAGPGPALIRPAAYLQRIARNLLVDHARRTSTKLARFHLPIDEVPDIAVPPEQALTIEAGDLMRSYRQAIAELPEKTRQAFLLHRLDGLGYKAIGERLEISVPTVQYHVARALVHIDRALERE
jgi:RNA polymerase sigma-70 factor (ECF subfamily)